jgi:hypothetical protein
MEFTAAGMVQYASYPPYPPPPYYPRLHCDTVGMVAGSGAVPGRAVGGGGGMSSRERASCRGGKAVAIQESGRGPGPEDGRAGPRAGSIFQGGAAGSNG